MTSVSLARDPAILFPNDGNVTSSCAPSKGSLFSDEQLSDLRDANLLVMGEIHDPSNNRPSGSVAGIQMLSNIMDASAVTQKITRTASSKRRIK
jgi:hypothetical protein